MKDEKKKLLQWHSAFFAGIQIELEEEAENLIFESEHTLSTKPMQIDVLIIKKNRKTPIKKNIGQIFRKYNILEYKSPDDYLSIDDFYKVYGYTCFYKADTGKTDEIKIDELTISFVCRHYPRELVKHLEIERQMKIEKSEDGIYYIHDAAFPIQIVVTSELPEYTNLWLKHLTNDLENSNTAEKLIRAYSRHEKEELYKSIMDIIVYANEDCFREAKNMCDALKELMKEELDEQRQQGISQGISQGEHKKLLEQIHKKILKGKSLAKIAEELEETEDVILPLYNQLKNKI